jgi:hypothetical protein
MILAADAAMTRGFQQVYDHVWDRWGMYVGTYRAAFVCAAYACDALHVFLREGLFFTLIYAVIIVPVLWLGFVRQHLSIENVLQGAGRFATINLMALMRQGRSGLLMRVAFVTILGLFAWLLGGTERLVQHLLSLVFVLCWTYATGVTVRERDTARFRRARPAYAGK